MLHDFRYTCWKGSHFNWVLVAAIPGILLIVAFPPISSLIILLKFQSKFDRTTILSTFGFMLSGLRVKKWEVYRLFFKLSLLIIPTLFLS